MHGWSGWRSHAGQRRVRELRRQEVDVPELLTDGNPMVDRTPFREPDRLFVRRLGVRGSVEGGNELYNAPGHEACGR